MEADSVDCGTDHHSLAASDPRANARHHAHQGGVVSARRAAAAFESHETQYRPRLPAAPQNRERPDCLTGIGALRKLAAMTCRVPWVFAIVAFSCGTGPHPIDSGSDADAMPTAMLGSTVDHVSGSRLRATIIDGGGGATIFVGWHDAMLGSDCTFLAMGDGTWRCLPQPAASVGFADANCTQPVAVLATSTPVPAFVPAVSNPFPSCGSSRYVVYAVGGVQSVPTVYFPLGAGHCSGFAVMPGQQVNSVTAADPSTFVGARLALVHHGEVDLEVFVGDDGSEQIRRIIDHARAITCRHGSVPPNQIGVDVRCVPEPDEQVSGSYFLDAACQGPSFALSSSTCTDVNDDPAFEVAITAMFPPGWPEATCVVESDVVWALGPRQTASALYRMGTTCATVSTSGGTSTVFPEQTTVDPNTLPTLHLGPQGTDRLRAPVFLAASDGAVVGGNPGRSDLGVVFWDEARGGYCFPFGETFADGVGRCIDDARVTLIGTAAYYGDPMCTEQLAIPHSGNCRMPSYALDFGAGGSSPVIGVRPVTGTYTDATVYRLNGGACVGQPTGMNEFWHVGAPVDPDTVFARVTSRTE